MALKRRITKKDHKAIAEMILQALKDRKGDKKRKEHEAIWAEVDRLVSMTPTKRTPKNGKVADWHNDVELGLLGDALEIIAADVMRIVMPNDRSWFQPHIEFPLETDEEGEISPLDPTFVDSENGQLKSLMSQQHADTGLRDGVKISVKEALKHGGFVAEARYDRFPRFYDGGGTQELGSPVWVPHSMWNCFPDPSQTVRGERLFYEGSMIITGAMRWPDVLKQKTWKNLKQAEAKADKSKDAKITRWFGDIFIPRSDSDIFVPNQKVILVEDTIVSVEPYDLPFSPIIYAGIERDDVRDVYFTSQLIKRTPNAKAATHSFNKFLDAVDLATEPPIAYDAIDPRFAAEGGPQIFPGSKVPSRSGGTVKVIYEANPGPALEGYLTQKQIVEQGTGVDAVRAGVSESVEQTATEVAKKDQRSEVRTVDLVSVIERQALRPYLYMHHELNKKELKDYPFYNNDPHTPDFLRANKADLTRRSKVVEFEITGARTVLGEERRRDGVLAVSQALLGTEAGAQLVGAKGLAQIARDIFSDFGVKDPERYLPNASFSGEETVSIEQVEQLQAEAQEAIQGLQEELQKTIEENETLNSNNKQLKVDLNAREEEKKLIEEQVQLNRIISNGKQEFERIQKRLAELQSELKVDEVQQEKNRDALLMLKKMVENNIRKGMQEPKEGDKEEATQENDGILKALTSFEEKLQAQDEEKQQKNNLIIDFLKQEGDEFAELAGSLETRE